MKILQIKSVLRWFFMQNQGSRISQPWRTLLRNMNSKMMGTSDLRMSFELFCGKSALNFYMHVRLGLRFHSNKVFHLLFFVSEGSIVSFFETILKSERIVLRLWYHIFETFLCTLATLDVLELARLGGKATTSHNKHSQ